MLHLQSPPFPITIFLNNVVAYSFMHLQVSAQFLRNVQDTFTVQLYSHIRGSIIILSTDWMHCIKLCYYI